MNSVLRAIPRAGTKGCDDVHFTVMLPPQKGLAGETRRRRQKGGFGQLPEKTKKRDALSRRHSGLNYTWFCVRAHPY